MKSFEQPSPDKPKRKGNSKTRRGNGASVWSTVKPWTYRNVKSPKAQTFEIGNKMQSLQHLPDRKSRREEKAKVNWETLQTLDEVRKTSLDERVKIQAAIALYDRTKEEDDDKEQEMYVKIEGGLPD